MFLLIDTVRYSLFLALSWPYSLHQRWRGCGDAMSNGTHKPMSKAKATAKASAVPMAVRMDNAIRNAMALGRTMAITMTRNRARTRHYP